MTPNTFVPYPLFPPYDLLGEHLGLLRPVNSDVRNRLDSIDAALEPHLTWRLGIDFLAQQCQSAKFTARHYKVLCPVIESMMHWSWSIKRKPLTEWQDSDAREFIRFIMRPPMSWVSSGGWTRYVMKTKTDFAIKPINDEWRPIVRKYLSESSTDAGLSATHHRDSHLSRGREFFAYIIESKSVTTPNPFNELRRKNFAVLRRQIRTTFTPAQLEDVMRTAVSLAERDGQWQPFLFMAAVAVYSDIPLRALGSTPVLKLTFSHFKATDACPDWFESPHYPGKRYPLNPQFCAYFQRFAQFRYERDPELGPHSFLLPQADGADAYGGHTLIDLFARFATNVLAQLQQGAFASRSYWKGSEQMQAGAALTFLELRKSAKAAEWAPAAMTSLEPLQDVNTWPNIGVRDKLPASQWLRKHAGTTSNGATHGQCNRT
ncbi:hypothetical protein RA263_08395 [Pseudomonas syringae pv. tagetis]|uniref:Integrase n=1 Tax=Pseudomonas syringae pv. tagetis TaxID=129140 RepID=A0ABW7NKC4_9PSED|nr:hypothetical protein [Pseudomonas syringae group genomosp. 7]UNB66353.1 hypothetical protein MME58_13940 [Pseudomonas syringae pv. tagetis]